MSDIFYCAAIGGVNKAKTVLFSEAYFLPKSVKQQCFKHEQKTAVLHQVYVHLCFTALFILFFFKVNAVILKYVLQLPEQL